MVGEQDELHRRSLVVRSVRSLAFGPGREVQSPPAIVVGAASAVVLPGSRNTRQGSAKQAA